MADTGDASSLTIANMTSGGEAPTFYPAVWHGIATVIYQVTGISVPATANLMSVLVGGGNLAAVGHVFGAFHDARQHSGPAQRGRCFGIVYGVPHAAHQLRCALPQ